MRSRGGEAPSEEEKMFEQIVRDQPILIADTSSASRTRLAKTLIELGAKTNRIHLVDSFTPASQYMDEIKPKLVLADYYLGNSSGFDLLTCHREKQAESKGSFFALITANGSQSAVARAAEEEVDTFILKPYTLVSLKRSLVQAAVNKFHPSPYIIAIESGKTDLFSGKIDESIEKFKQAQALDTQPSLACFYLGHAQQTKKILEGASNSFKEGLTYNKIHYRCLVGLFDLLNGQRRFKDAYEVLKRVSQYFPANPTRLGTVLRLSIVTSNFEDIEKYYQVFTSMDARDEELVKYMCAALVVCGKHYLIQGTRSRALELFEKVGVSSAGRTSFLRRVIETLCEFSLPKEALKYLDRFPPATQSGKDFLFSKYLLTDLTDTANASVEMGRKLVKAGVRDAAVYHVLIKRLDAIGKHDNAEQIRNDAERIWPGEFLGGATKAATPGAKIGAA